MIVRERRCGQDAVRGVRAPHHDVQICGGRQKLRIDERRGRWIGRCQRDFTSAFRFHDADQTTPSLPDTNGSLNLATYETSQFRLLTFPGSNQVMPAQEPGVRRRVP